MTHIAGAAVAEPSSGAGRRAAPAVPAAVGTAAAAEPDLPPKFDQWFREHREPVYQYVRIRVASRDVAEDITSEVFLKALRALPRYNARRAAPRTWLLAIARNAVVDHLRWLKRHGSLVSLDRGPDLVSGVPCPEERMLRQERMSRLLDGVARLRQADQDLIALRYGAGLAIPEIAEALKITENAVSVRMHRALKCLRAAVRQPGRASGGAA